MAALLRVLTHLRPGVVWPDGVVPPYVAACLAVKAEHPKPVMEGE